MFYENPYFQQWLCENIARMGYGFPSKRALAYGATRMAELSIAVADLPNPRQLYAAQLATTNLIARLKKQP